MFYNISGKKQENTRRVCQNYDTPSYHASKKKNMPDGMKKACFAGKSVAASLFEAESSMLPAAVQPKSEKAHCLVTSDVSGIVFPAKQAFFAVRQLFSLCGKPPQVARVLIDTAAKVCFRGRGNQHTQF